ncbi:MAG: T9SS type A sorting domain-containing protein [bacterium]|nr:T9SS type A sorting domain-containing protein [bacterium]
MKTLYATLLCVFGLSLSTFAQVSSDDPTVENESTSKVPQAPTAPILPQAAVAGDIFPCGGGTDTLINTGSCGSVWASDSLGTNILSMTDTLVFGPITADTTLYLIGLQGTQNASTPLPGHGSNYSGNVRGYWFTSPVDMIITGFWIPTEGSTANQNVECVIFNNQTPPPLWSNTTNDFVSQGYWNNYPANDTIDACIQVSAGDVIGIYGQRGTQNSYGTSPFVSDIDGNAVTFTRSGMQQSLTTNQMANIFQESGGSISRVEFFYDVNPTPGSSTPVNVIVPQPTTASANATICNGDSIFVGGGYQTTAGVYTDTLNTVFGCDSVVTTTLSTDQSYFIQNNENICAGDSILLGGAYQTTAGFYTDSLQTVLGCDSTIVTFLDITSPPSVSFTAPVDTICAQADPFSMNGTPAGGVYTGTGVSGDMFDPSSANLGGNIILYEVTDGPCYESASAIFYVQDCASIGEPTLEGVSVYPNPASSIITVSLPDYISEGTAVLYDANGRLVQTHILTETISTLDIGALSAGVYVVEVNNTNGQSAQFRLIKK